MKKQLIISTVTIVLLLLGFSGCFEDSNKDKENGISPEVKLFLGKWKTTIYCLMKMEQDMMKQSSNSTFYTNGTMGSESAYEGDEMIWTPYVIQNNQICLGEANDYRVILVIIMNFSDDETEATLWTYCYRSIFRF